MSTIEFNFAQVLYAEIRIRIGSRWLRIRYTNSMDNIDNGRKLWSDICGDRFLVLQPTRIVYSSHLRNNRLSVSKRYRVHNKWLGQRILAWLTFQYAWLRCQTLTKSTLYFSSLSWYFFYRLCPFWNEQAREVSRYYFSLPFSFMC